MNGIFCRKKIKQIHRVLQPPGGSAPSDGYRAPGREVGTCQGDW